MVMISFFLFKLSKDDVVKDNLLCDCIHIEWKNKIRCMKYVVLICTTKM